jgi:hypothetical protein
LLAAALSTGPEQRSPRAARFETNALSVLLIAAVRLFFKPNCELTILTKEKFESFALICSSTRICSVSFFGGLGGGFRIATSVLLWCLRLCRIPVIDIKSYRFIDQSFLYTEIEWPEVGLPH